MEQIQTKTDCTVTIAGTAFNALLHLIELRYSGRIVFWNGVLQIASSLPGIGDVPFPCLANVSLPNGKSGTLRLTYFDIQDGYFELAGAGEPHAG